MPRAASRCNKAITAPVWLVQGKSFSWGFTWSSTLCLQLEEVRPDLLQVCSREKHQLHPFMIPSRKGEFPPSVFPCTPVANRAIVQHKPLFWASFLPPSFLEQFPACSTSQLLCPLPWQGKLSASVAACADKIQPPQP